MNVQMREIIIAEILSLQSIVFERGLLFEKQYSMSQLDQMSESELQMVDRELYRIARTPSTN